MITNDEAYLGNEMIAAAFSGNDPIAVSRVFTAIEKKFKADFFNRVCVRRHYLLAADVLNGIADDAFSEMQRLFYDKVRSKEFHSEVGGNSGYLFRLFQNSYRNFYRKEMTFAKHNFFRQHQADTAVHPHTDLPAWNRPEGLYQIIRTAISRLKDRCKEVLTAAVSLQNAEHQQAVVAGGAAAAAAQLYRCKQQLKQVLKEDFGYDF